MSGMSTRLDWYKGLRVVIGGAFGAAVSLTLVSFTNSAVAQIIPDPTLPISSSVTREGNTSFIQGGTLAGSNLFQSFEDFSIPTGSETYFNNAPNLQNIITRVTGGSVSNIDGLIRANGAANLFLLNPSGIIFGPNASLDIGGSFLASTASAVKFADGTEFNANAPDTTYLLTESVPIGLQYGVNPGSILNKSQTTNRSGEIVGLQVQPGNTLALIGGNVALGGYLTAPNGRIELGSVVGNSLVSLTPTPTGYTLGYEGVEDFQDISLTQGAFVTTSGDGSIQVQGANVTLTDGSRIQTITQEGAGGSLTVNARESVQLIGRAADSQYASGLFTSTVGTGTAGQLTINTQDLVVSNGARVTASTTGVGAAGDIRITASSVLLDNGNITVHPSGNGGNITLNVGDLLLLRGGSEISATTVLLDNGNILLVRPGREISATTGTEAGGVGGNISISAPSIPVVIVNRTSVPESSAVLGVLAIGALGVPSVLRSLKKVS